MFTLNKLIRKRIEHIIFGFPCYNNELFQAFLGMRSLKSDSKRDMEEGGND